MITFKQITFKEAMNMIEIGEIKQLYFLSDDGSIDCVTKYKTWFDSLKETIFFKREKSS